MSETILTTPETKRARVLKLRLPVVCLVAFWAAFIVVGTMEKLYFHSFLSQLISAALFTLLFFGWWWFNRGLRFLEKFAGFAIIVSGAVIAAKFLDRSVSPFVLWRLGIPIVATVVVLWFKRARRIRAPFIGGAFFLLVYATWSCFLLVRSEGADSALKQAYFLRWTPSSEERFLAIRPSPDPAKAADSSALMPLKNQWTQFRGENRDGVVSGSSISTNWNAGPTQVWKRPVGPAWSAVSIVGRRLFTQEQRGVSEAVVCYDAENGDELWAHEDAARFDESLSGIGPRATPTFHEGKLFTLGATGLLNCLDAATGKSIWQKNIAIDSGSNPPQWGFSSSPMVIDGKVIVHAGGEKGLLAYSVEKGELLWSAPAGKTSYSSPQVNVVDGATQCLMLHDAGLMGVDLATGKKLWETGQAFLDSPRSNQPHLVGANNFIVGALIGSGTASIHVKKSGESWSATTNWVSRDLKPEFPDIVVYKDHAYGFDVSLFCCINLSDGKRAWKEGRYGRGQVVLLADQGLLLVAAENGDLVLLGANPTAHRELDKFKALQGKTWAGPVVDGDKVYHRNAQEMACYSFADAKKIAAR